MNSKIIGVLVAIIILSVAVFFLVSRRSESTDPMIGTSLFPDLKGHLDGVVGVKIRSKTGEVSLASVDGRWVVSSRFDYAVDFERLGKLFENLSLAKYAERKTAKPENFQRLGLRALDGEASDAVEVSLTFKEGTEKSVLVGKLVSGRTGQFFRFAGEDQAWMMDRSLQLETAVTDWLKPVIVNVDADRISRITLTPATGKPVILVRKAGKDGDFEVLDMPVGRKLKYTTVANELSRSLVNLRLKDAMPVAGFDWTKSDRADFHCRDGLVVTIQTKSADGRYYLGLTAKQEPAATAPKTGAGAAPAKDQGSLVVHDSQAVAAEAAKLKSTVEPWVFEVTEYAFADFTKTMDDFLESAKEKK